LKRLFPEIEDPQSSPSTTLVPFAGNETIAVAVMGGETAIIPYQGNMTVLSLKYKIQERFGIEPQKQRLLYKEKELKVTEGVCICRGVCSVFWRINYCELKQYPSLF
jgi:hypothetical protein